LPTKRFALEPNQPKRLEISWKGNWKRLAVSLDATPVGAIETKKELQGGKEFTLADGSTLEVRLRQTFFSPELQLLRNGSPIPGSGSDPQARLAMAYGVIFFVAGLSAIVGVIAELFHIDLLLRLGFGIWSLVGAAIYGILGYFVRKRSLSALIIAIALFALDGVLSIVLAAEQGLQPSGGGIVTRIILLIPMIRGVPAIQALKQATPTSQVG
jgi:hypothetical protein